MKRSECGLSLFFLNEIRLISSSDGCAEATRFKPPARIENPVPAQQTFNFLSGFVTFGFE